MAEEGINSLYCILDEQITWCNLGSNISNIEPQVWACRWDVTQPHYQNIGDVSEHSNCTNGKGSAHTPN